MIQYPWLQKVKEYYPNYITDELVKEYQDLRKKAKTPWELKEARERFFKEHDIIVERTIEKQYRKLDDISESDRHIMMKNPDIMIDGEMYAEIPITLESEEGDVRVSHDVTRGFGTIKEFPKNRADVLSDFVGKVALVAVSMTHDIISLFLSVLDVFVPEADYVKYTDCITYNNNAYTLVEKIVSVYSRTPYGYEFVPYVIAEKREADLHTFSQWFKGGRSDNSSEVFSNVQTETNQFYNNDVYLANLAIGYWQTGMGNVEILPYDIGTRTNNYKNLP